MIFGCCVLQVYSETEDRTRSYTFRSVAAGNYIVKVRISTVTFSIEEFLDLS